MTQFEKTINGTKCCRDMQCTSCPYNIDWEKRYCITNLCRDALELLKEQEPKPVLSPHIDRFCMRAFAEYIAYCPNCKQEILEKHNKSYCGFCGQAVKWNE